MSSSPPAAQDRAQPSTVVTLFACPKAFHGHIGVIQRNSLASWVRLGSQVEILLLGQEDGLAQAAGDFGVRHLSHIARNEMGTPLLDSVFDLAQREARGRLMCYANADILFLDDFLPAVQRVAEKFERFLVVGGRWDLDVDRMDYGPGWVDALRDRLGREGRPHGPKGSDYFVFPRGVFTDIPPFALGRAGWDNWMIYAGRAAHMPVIDGSQSITVIHQDHDYAHLPGGKPHYRLPESAGNVRLAGGREMIFTPRDADWELDGSGLCHRRWDSPGRVRGLEIALIARFGSGIPARLARMGLHPATTVSYYWRALARRLGRARAEEWPGEDS